MNFINAHGHLKTHVCKTYLSSLVIVKVRQCEKKRSTVRVIIVYLVLQAIAYIHVHDYLQK